MGKKIIGTYDKIEQLNTNKNLFKMSIPLFIELMLNLLVGNIDQIMISRYSQSSVAAVVNGNQVMNLVIVVLNMISMGTTIILSQYLGANDKKNSSRTCVLSLSLISVISVLVTVIILLFKRNIFQLLNVEQEILEETITYLTIVAAFILIQGLYLNFAAILRTFSFIKQVMYVTIIMNILNIIGNALLINGWIGFPRMGITGAAISTVISKSIGLCIIIYLFYRKVNMSLKLKFLNPFPKKIFGKLCMISLPSGAESLSYNLSQMCILGFVNIFGTMVTATKGYCSILANFDYIYAVAMSQAMQIVLGYLLGAGRISQIEKRVWNTVKIAWTVCISVAILLFLNSNIVFRMFTSQPEVLALGRRILFLEIFLEIGRATNIVMTRSLIAVGDAVTPMVVGITGEWAIAFLFSYILGIKLNWGLEGIWIAMACDECIRGLIYVIRFKQVKWKKKIK